MQLLESSERKITKDKNGKDAPHLEVVKLLYTFVPNKPFGSLLEISPTNHIFLKTFSSESEEIKVWFTDQTSKPLKVEDKINLTLIIK